VFEERVMGEDMISDDVGDPAYLVVGLEGFWGTLLCIAVLYPITYFLPGDDNGSLESPFNALHMVGSSHEIQVTLFWYSILDLFRPGTVWGFDLFLYYSSWAGEQAYGEPWVAGCSTWQLLGLFMLLLSTAVYAEIIPLPSFLQPPKKQQRYSNLQKSPGRSPFLSRQAVRRTDAEDAERQGIAVQYRGSAGAGGYGSASPSYNATRQRAGSDEAWRL
jgi:hypothetical protein